MKLSDSQHTRLLWLARIGGRAVPKGQYVVNPEDPQEKCGSGSLQTFLFLVSKGLVRGGGGFIRITAYGYRMLGQKPPELFDDPDTDAERLNFVDSECAEIRCREVRMHDDADVSYEVVTFYQAEPRERMWGIGRSPRIAIDDAIRTRKRVPEQCTFPTGHGELCNCAKTAEPA